MSLKGKTICSIIGKTAHFLTNRVFNCHEVMDDPTNKSFQLRLLASHISHALPIFHRMTAASNHEVSIFGEDSLLVSILD